MIESVKIWLRGDYNSIRYRFGSLPVAWLTYFGYALSGKGWLAYYSARLDKSQLRNLDAPLPEAYKANGAEHLKFMKAQGLMPQHKLLDYGCGVMRSGIQFAKYLEPGRYFGVDISAERLKRGRKLMKQEGVAEDAFRAVHVSDCRLGELQGMEFDYVFANSVLTHMPKQDIRELLRAMRSVLAPSGRFYFTYSEADRAKRRNLKDFWYPTDEIRAMCEEAGYRFTVVPGWPFSDVMGMVTPADRSRVEAAEPLGE